MHLDTLSGSLQPLFFCLNLPVQFFASSFFRSLLYKLTLDGILKNGLLHILRELGIKLFQLFISCGITVNIPFLLCN